MFVNFILQTNLIGDRKKQLETAGNVVFAIYNSTAHLMQTLPLNWIRFNNNNQCLRMSAGWVREYDF